MNLDNFGTLVALYGDLRGSITSGPDEYGWVVVTRADGVVHDAKWSEFTTLGANLVYSSDSLGPDAVRNDVIAYNDRLAALWPHDRHGMPGLCSLNEAKRLAELALATYRHRDNAR